MGDQARIVEKHRTPNVQRRPSKSQSEKLARGTGKHACFLFSGKFHRFDEVTRFRFTQGKGIIRAECDTLRAKEFEQHSQRIGIVHE